MKAETLFKAKRIDNGEWIEGDLSHDVITGKVYVSRQDGYPPTWNDPGGCDIYICVEVYPETICQYTGLKDRNGNRIFEGDILTSTNYPFQDEGKRNYDAIVEWFEQSWQYVLNLVNKDKRGISDGMNSRLIEGGEFEIIGNIHDNK